MNKIFFLCIPLILPLPLFTVSQSMCHFNKTADWFLFFIKFFFADKIRFSLG